MLTGHLPYTLFELAVFRIGSLLLDRLRVADIEVGLEGFRNEPPQLGGLARIVLIAYYDELLDQHRHLVGSARGFGAGFEFGLCFFQVSGSVTSPSPY